MTEKKEKRAERLVKFRKLERDRASRALENARAARESAQHAVEIQKEMVETEAERVNSSTKPTSPEAYQLALACVEATRFDLQTKLEILKNAEKQLNSKSKALLVTHRKVQQMEALKNKAVSDAKTIEKRKEQLDIDDLAANREARQ